MTNRNSAEPPRVLLAEDDKEMRSLISRALNRDGYKVTEVADGADLITHLSDMIDNRQEPWTEHYDLVISDIRMPGVLGITVLEGIEGVENAPPMILITAFGDDETHAQAKKMGAAGMFDKPFKMDDLMARVREVVPPNAQTAA